MPSDTLHRSKGRTASSSPPVPPAPAPVLVRLTPGVPDDAAAPLIDVAIAVARGLGRGVRLVGQPRAPREGEAPIDPVEWDLARRAVEAHLATLIERHADARCPLDFRVPDRFARDELDVDDPVVALARGTDAPPWHADGAVREFLAAGPGSVLVVPARAGVRRPVRIGRIVTPLDGSARAECALSSAFEIARRHGAEVVLVHVSSEAPLTAAGAYDADTRALADALGERNRRAADTYLASVRARQAGAGVALRTCLLDAGDARRRLVDVADAEHADLIVAAAHGASGHADVPSGTVASYVLEHASVPVLMIGAGASPCEIAGGRASEASGPRPPGVSKGRW